MRCAYYKFYYPSEWYRVLLENWAQDVSSFDYDEARAIKNKSQLTEWKKKVRKEESQDAQAKFKIRLGELIYEMKLRGYEVCNGNIYSAPTSFVIEDNDPYKIYMPLISINGISDNTANQIYETLKDRPFTTCEDIITRKNSFGRVVFNKKTLRSLGLIYKEKCLKCDRVDECRKIKKLKDIIDDEKTVDE